MLCGFLIHAPGCHYFYQLLDRCTCSDTLHGCTLAQKAGPDHPAASPHCLTLRSHTVHILDKPALTQLGNFAVQERHAK